MKTSSWYLLPWVAALLAVAFVIWDAQLMSRTVKVQERMNGHVAQLEQFTHLGAAIDRLAVAHKAMDQGDAWGQELARVRDMSHRAFGQPQATTSMAPIRGQMERDLAACDSLHHQTRQLASGSEELQMAEAVLGLMMQRTRSHLDNAVRIVHKEGLGQTSVLLGNQWNRAQWLLGLASLFALVCAVLAAYVARLWASANERSTLLARTGEELERRNRELRETMLSKEEKEVMLKEIHHRVKNNLQIVRSLIRFQTDKVSDPRTLELFNECVNRVGAMALVHEQTYMSKDLANINVANYLNSLVRDLVSAYNIRMRLKMDVDIQVDTLGVDTLTPLGLLINEVVSNSFKHAFKGRDEGTIILHLNGTEEGGLLLRVGDDGIGLPNKDTWHKPNSLGMDLIHTLSGQLNATMTLEPGPGMVYQLISAPEVEVRRRA